MPLIEKRTIAQGLDIGLWDITESDDFFFQRLFLANEMQFHLNKMHPKRRSEWLAGRWLLKEVAGKNAICQKDKFGKPYLKNSTRYISISHSHGLAAVSVGERSLGIDIQKITPKIRRIAHKFMRPTEADSLENESYLDHLTVYWSAKEALYKAYGKKELDFRKNILVTPFTYQFRGELTGAVSKNDFYATYDLNYEKIGGHMLVLAMEQKTVSFPHAAVMS